MIPTETNSQQRHILQCIYIYYIVVNFSPIENSFHLVIVEVVKQNGIVTLRGVNFFRIGNIRFSAGVLIAYIDTRCYI